MPSNYNTETFNESIQKRIRRLFDAANTQSKSDLITNLLEVEKKFKEFYPRNERKAQEMFRGLLQNLMYFICQTINEGHPEYLCQIIMAQCPNIFHIPATPRDRCSTMVWTHPRDASTLLDAVEKRGFKKLLDLLIDQASTAIAKEQPNPPNAILKKTIYLTWLKQKLLCQFQHELNILWRPYEHVLSIAWETLLRSHFEYYIQIQELFSEEEVLLLKQEDVVNLVEWLDKLHDAIINLIGQFRDPITNYSLLDKMSENPQSDHHPSLPRDPVCFLGDGRAYLLSTFKQLMQSNISGAPLISPVTGKEIEPFTQASNSLIGFFKFSRSLNRLKEHIQSHAEISIKTASKIASIGRPSSQRLMGTSLASDTDELQRSLESTEAYDSQAQPGQPMASAMNPPPPYPGPQSFSQPSAPSIPHYAHGPSAPTFFENPPPNFLSPAPWQNPAMYMGPPPGLAAHPMAPYAYPAPPPSMMYPYPPAAYPTLGYPPQVQMSNAMRGEVPALYPAPSAPLSQSTLATTMSSWNPLQPTSNIAEPSADPTTSTDSTVDRSGAPFSFWSTPTPASGTPSHVTENGLQP